jgi:ELWxxDGT repeat protein
LYFSAFQPETSYELYSYDPVTETATQRTNVSGNINPEFLAVYQNKLYMKGRLTSQEGTELLFYDSESDTIQMAADMGPGSSNPMWLTVFKDNLYFAATTDEFGTELWEYDGENAVIYTDIYQGVPSSNPEWLAVFNNKLYFSANDGEKGSEIWSLAGCINVFVDAEPVYHPDSLGTVSLSIEGGTPPYKIQWSNGSTEQNPEDLPPGEYTLVVIDDTGCIVKLRVEITLIDLTNTPETTVEESVVAYPNPGNGTFTIEWGTLQPKEILVFDMKGQLIRNQEIPLHETEARIILQDVKSGTYFLQLRTTDNVIYKKVVVN